MPRTRRTLRETTASPCGSRQAHTRAARFADGAAHGVPLGRREGGAPGIVARVVRDHAVGREGPEHAAHVPLHRGDERRRREPVADRSEEHTSELQSLAYLVCRLLLEKKKK